MKISLGSRFKSIGDSNGYGYATNCMLDSLDRLGYHVGINDSSADVEIWFDQPHHWKFSKDTYKIGYHPWESTLLIDGWAEIMNECDEIWTPSPLIAQWYRQFNGIIKPIYVYEHGVDHVWEPRERKVEDKIKFLHVGGETRKGGWDLPRLFRRAFSGVNDRDVSLTLKMIQHNWNGIENLGRTHYINKKYDFGQLQDLFYEHHVYIYPSYGEGFGLTPLQAMATGMPTITLPGWAPYKQFLDPNLGIKHDMAKTKWPEIHPGRMMRPDFDDIIDKMRYVVDNFDESSSFALNQTQEIHKYYDWDRLTAQTFGALEERFSR